MIQYTLSSLSRRVALGVTFLALSFGSISNHSLAAGGSGGGGSVLKVDSIKVSKCYCNGSQMLIKASSSDPTAVLAAYRPDGTFQGYVQNGGGSRYGGTVMGFVPSDPGSMTLTSSSGGRIVVPTTPFLL